MTPLKLIFMGTPEFALPALAALYEAGHDIAAVYTQPPRPAGRGQKEKISPVHAYALAKNIAVYTPATLKHEETQRNFSNHGADAAIVAAYGLLLPQAILSGTRMGCINVHPSLLPRWRGAAPLQRTIMAGDKETGVVIMQMDAGLDTGDMLMIRRLPVADGTTTGELHDALSKMAAPMVLETLEGLAQGTIAPIRQPEDGVTYAKKIIKDECRIDWREPALAVRQKILGLNPAPGAYFIAKEEIIKVLNAEFAPGDGKEPGAVLDETLTVQCGDAALRLTLVQRQGKKPMPAIEMLKGFAIATGEKL